MTNKKETLVDWLRDAHAMEASIVTLLEKQAKKLEDDPTMRNRIEGHIEVTREHAEKVKRLVEDLGGDVSRVKEGTGKLMANVQALTAAAAPDSKVKNTLANFAIEHFEIASYRSIIAAADEIGQTDVTRVCRDILADEEEMAGWLDEQIPRVTRGYLQAEATQRQ